MIFEIKSFIRTTYLQSSIFEISRQTYTQIRQKVCLKMTFLYVPKIYIHIWSWYLISFTSYNDLTSGRSFIQIDIETILIGLILLLKQNPNQIRQINIITDNYHYWNLKDSSNMLPYLSSLTLFQKEFKSPFSIWNTLCNG